VTRPARSLAGRISDFFWPHLYAGIKIRLLLLLLIGLLVTPLLEIQLVFPGGKPWPHLASGSEVGPVSAVLWLAAVGFLFWCDWLIERRRARFDRELASFIADPDLPDEFRETVLVGLLRERNGRY
jgi:hypothetical protein